MSEVELTEAQSKEKEETIPFYPDHAKNEFYVIVGLTILAMVVGLIGLFYPVGLEEPADPMNTPLHVKPEWYFLALYQLLRYIPKTIGAVLPVLAVILMMVWPFIDHKADKSKKAYRVRAIFAAVALVILIIMTIWGKVS